MECGRQHNSCVVSEEEVRVIVSRAIRVHEARVALISGILGLLLLAGTWHAIYTLNIRSLY